MALWCVVSWCPVYLIHWSGMQKYILSIDRSGFKDSSTCYLKCSYWGWSGCLRGGECEIFIVFSISLKVHLWSKEKNSFNRSASVELKYINNLSRCRPGVWLRCLSSHWQTEMSLEKPNVCGPRLQPRGSPHLGCWEPPNCAQLHQAMEVSLGWEGGESPWTRLCRASDNEKKKSGFNYYK